MGELQRVERSSLLHVCYLVYMLTTGYDDAIHQAWHRMFTAAAACLRNNNLEGQGPPITSCQGEHTATCDAAFAFLRRMHASEARPIEPDEVESAISRSQIPDELVDVLRCLVCSFHTADPDTGTAFWRVKRLARLDQKRPVKLRRLRRRRRTTSKRNSFKNI